MPLAHARGPGHPDALCDTLALALVEEYLRRALTISRGDPTVFFTRPLSATLLAIAAVLLVLVFLPAISKKREEAFQED